MKTKLRQECVMDIHRDGSITLTAADKSHITLKKSPLDYGDGVESWYSMSGGRVLAKGRLAAAAKWSKRLGWKLRINGAEREELAKAQGWTWVRRICIGFSTELTPVGYDPQKRKELEIVVEGHTYHLVPHFADEV